MFRIPAHSRLVHALPAFPACRTRTVESSFDILSSFMSGKSLVFLFVLHPPNRRHPSHIPFLPVHEHVRAFTQAGAHSSVRLLNLWSNIGALVGKILSILS